MSTPETASERPARGEAIRLTALFGLLYFLQGISEPTEGLIAQPFRSLLKSWGQNTQQIGTWAAIVSLPWAIKPLYGLISDFLPLAGYKRKSYLVLSSAITSASLIALYLVPLPSGAIGTLIMLLVPATIGVAFSDVVIDALMVEKGQPLGLTGRIQSVQWGTIYAASILTGLLGGYLSGVHREELGFLICGLAMLGTLALGIWSVHEPRGGDVERQFWPTLKLLARSSVSRSILAAGAYLFLWSFNPFSTTVQYMYITKSLGYSEQFYGWTLSVHAIGAMLGGLTYALYCRRLSMRTLVHLSIVLGIASTVAYWGLSGHVSAQAIAFVSGFALIAGTVIQLDLAAQVCPPQVAGTLFSLLMALSNLGTTTSTWLGGGWYEALRESGGDAWAFNVLVAIGAAFTAGCWLIVPLLAIPKK